MTYAKQAGALYALDVLGISKTAYIAPALLGSAIGSSAGFLAAPENNRIEGAMLGGLGGGLGAVAGKSLGAGSAKLRHALAKRNLAKEMAKSQGDLFTQLAAKERMAAADKMLGSGAGALAGATLGGLAGTGAGAYAADRNQTIPPSEDPYGYRFRTQ